MGIAKTCFQAASVAVALLAVFFGFIVLYARQSTRLQGSLPAFVNENRIDTDSFLNMEGRVVVVTGANVGLGKSATKHLALQGAKVIMGCRSMKRCEEAKREISLEVAENKISKLSKAKTHPFKKSNLVPMEIDLSDFNSVAKFANKFKKTYDRLDSLMLNAGIAHVKYYLTKESKIEGHMAVNHFGHFLLTKLLLDVVERSQPSTIVVVASGSHHSSYDEGVRLSLEAINSPKKYNKISAYGQSKLANILFAQELADKLASENKRVYVNSVHPGAVFTSIARYQSRFIRRIAPYFYQAIAFESDDSALNQVHAAISKEIFEKEISRQYFVPYGVISDTHQHAKNMTLQKELWKLSEDVVSKFL